MVRPRTIARSSSVWAFATLLLATVLLSSRGLNLAVDFTGGVIVSVHAPEGLALVEDALRETGVHDVGLERLRGQPSDIGIVVQQREALLSPQSARLLAQQLASALNQRHVDVTRLEIIAPSVGRELLREGAIPPLFAFVCVVIYAAVRHGGRYALFAAVATGGVMAIVIGLILSAYAVFQWEFSVTSFLAMDGFAIAVAAIGWALRPRARVGGVRGD